MTEAANINVLVPPNAGITQRAEWEYTEGEIANIAGLPIADIDRLGSVVVALGNNFATVESQIVDFTQRIAGAGQIAGLSVADVAGIGTAFASLVPYTACVIVAHVSSACTV